MLEAVAVVLAIAYLLLAARENILCWYCAFVSSALYTVIFWDVSLLMESLLNIFYVVMAVVGWQQWRFGGRAREGVRITRLRVWQHAAILVGLAAAALINGWFMQRYTTAAWPVLDSFTTWASVFNTFLVVRKVLENWLYWILIDGISIYLYIDRELYLTALLFTAYVVIVVFGWLSWRRLYREQQTAGRAVPSAGR